MKRAPLLAIMVVIVTIPCIGAPRQDALVFITTNPQSTLSSAELRNLYLGRTTRWKNGRRVALIVRPASTTAGNAFLKQVVRMSEIDFSQHWLGVVFRGEAPSPPRVVEAAQAVVKIVIENPDALAFVMESELEGIDEHSLHRTFVSLLPAARLPLSKLLQIPDAVQADDGGVLLLRVAAKLRGQFDERPIVRADRQRPGLLQVGIEVVELFAPIAPLNQVISPLNGAERRGPFRRPGRIDHFV
jgi:hypothetical protein